MKYNAYESLQELDDEVHRIDSRHALKVHRHSEQGTWLGKRVCQGVGDPQSPSLALTRIPR